MSETTTPPDYTTATWKGWIRTGQSAQRAIDKGAWKIGDLAVQVQEHQEYGEAAVTQFAADLGIARSSMYQYLQTSKAYAESGRSDRNGWSVHFLFRNEVDRAELVAAKKWSYRDAQAEVKARKGKSDAPTGGGEGDSAGDTAEGSEGASVQPITSEPPTAVQLADNALAALVALLNALPEDAPGRDALAEQIEATVTAIREARGGRLLKPSEADAVSVARRVRTRKTA
ncbi:hypothetical protein [Asanoa iriomotensis]|uniref:Uncharacterized protein n=1 Tax=Asanoa iriomotensis TaxID=234613 RepID=A0ABQ4CBU2_9ACTN|nr:hypothetical protein [Asanoa iriomotensis]GIF60231.1 hypothetical protein Air01nite_63260 [Asanoa iriomotensis]